VEEGEALAERAVRAYGLTALGERLLEVVEEVQDTNVSRKPRKVAEKPLAVVVTTHNHLDKTQETVRALRASCGVAHIVLADDGSTDETRAWAERESVMLLPLSGGNVSANRQVAVEYLRDTLHWDGYIAFLDNDVVVPRGWWTGLQRVFAEEPAVGVLAPLKRYASGKLQNVGNRLFLNGGSVPCLLERGRVLVDYVETACMVVRPDVWRSIRWDSRFPLFYEDVDYCFQARAKGFQVMATAEVSVVHDAHTSSGVRASEAEPNRMRFLQKWKAQI
jgi:GT2 family glycosyltransferase